MKHVALVTDVTIPTLSKSDSLLIEPLKSHGFAPHVVAWDNPQTDWSLFDTILLRACWNYPKKYQLFLDWISNTKTTMWNTPDIVKWNSHKSYLLDLAKKGIPIIPTVIKPAVSNRGEGIEYLIQPFMPEVQDEGEYRFIFIGKKLTHTVLKKPKQILLINPSKALIAQAEAVIQKIDADILYARVDGINHNQTFMLMELELIEPELYFDLNPKAATTLAQTLKLYG